MSHVAIDLDNLKAKYSELKSKSQITTENNSTDQTKIFEQNETNVSKLDKYKICNSCQGLGVVQYIYNHMVLQKECEKCHGESIINISPEIK